MVVAVFFTSAIAYGVSCPFGVFLKPIMADMGWQRGTASGALAFGELFGELLGDFAGDELAERVEQPGLGRVVTRRRRFLHLSSLRSGR